MSTARWVLRRLEGPAFAALHCFDELRTCPLRRAQDCSRFDELRLTASSGLQQAQTSRSVWSGAMSYPRLSNCVLNLLEAGSPKEHGSPEHDELGRESCVCSIRAAETNTVTTQLA